MSKSPSEAPQSASQDVLYRSLVESLPVGVILTDAHRVKLHVNAQASRMTGYSVEELMVGVWMVHPDEVEARALYELAHRDCTPSNDCEARLIRKDGSVFWASISWRPVVDENNVYAGMCTVLVDISERKNAEEALQRADERYRALSENSTDIFFEWDLDGTITYVSNSVQQIGYTPEDIIGTSVFDLVPPDGRAASHARRKKQLSDFQPLRHEIRVFAKDGTERWLEAQVDLVMYNGKPLKVQAVHRDVTERKRAEAALRDSERKYKTIVESSADMIMLTTPDGVIAYASPAARNICGYEPEELVSDNPWMIHPLDTEKMRATFQRARQGVSQSGVEYRIVTKSKETRWVSHSWSPIMDGDRVQMVVSIFRDITERKQSEEALRKAHADLEQAYRLQQEFLNNVTHEVRTPLTAVKGYAEMLLEGLAGPVSEEQATLLGKVLTSSQHLLDVVNSVLEIARLKTGRIELNNRFCDPRAIVEKSVSTVLPQAQWKQLQLNVHSDAAGCLGLYDEGKLLIILANLLTNAVKFTEAGSVEVLVTCCPSFAEIVVVDTGMGISSSDLPNIFEEFTQLDYPRKHKPSGFGIGLSIVATMVETIGATLIVSSEKDLGTAFTLRVPVLEAGGPD